MEKRYVTFIALSLALIIAHQLFMATFFPAPPPEEVAVEEPKDPVEGENGNQEPGDPGPSDTRPDDTGSGDQDPGDQETPVPEADPDKPAAPDSSESSRQDDSQDVEEAWHALGSYDSGKHVVYLTNAGAAVRCVELVERLPNGKLKYRDLVNRSGHLGYLGLQAQRGGGCRVNVVADGSPAAKAGIAIGDVITMVGGQAVERPYEVVDALRPAKPGDTVELQVEGPDGTSRPVSVTLAQRPLALLGEETDLDGVTLSHPPSFRLTLDSLRANGQTAQIKRGQTEIAGLPSLLRRNWQISSRDRQSIAFTTTLTEADLEEAGISGQLEITKRLALPAETEPDPLDYHLGFDVSIKNVGAAPLQVAYSLHGPNGLPTEGWWYLYKVHPDWGTGGARDVVWKTENGHQLRSASEIWKQKGNQKTPEEPAFISTDSIRERNLAYVGVDTQYFNVALLPRNKAGEFASREFQEVTPFLINPATSLDKKHVRLGNVSFRMVSEVAQLEPNATLDDGYFIFLGPKTTPVLDHYGLEETIVWGWFWWVAKPLSALLHAFFALVRNYGLAILMLTVMVRACVHPISRKAHKSSAVMQELAPEMKKIAEKHKDDPQKRMQAQQELYKQHNFNPLSGCLLAFAQFPIFIGLYRCLSVDIELRDAALIPGVNWCTNLAGPDMLFNWGPNAFAWLTDYTGWLGPYLNVLPLISVVLFLVQQKMMTPPPTDEQQAMQQKMMKVMTAVIGVLFYKVASGLCLYIIISSLWGVIERQLMPKKQTSQGTPVAPVKDKPKRSPEDARRDAKRRRKPRGR